MIQAMATAHSLLISHIWLSPETCRYICEPHSGPREVYLIDNLSLYF